MSAAQPVPYQASWDTVPIAFVDFETTGLRPGIDQAVEVGIARFERGQLVAQRGSLLDPGTAIPAEASEIHGITDAMVSGKPTIAQWFAQDDTRALLSDAQPAAYNAGFDRWFCPPWALADWTWPWLDTLTLVRIVDRYVRGAGRHKLTNACARHRVPLLSAHRADDDARAAVNCFFKLMPRVWNNTPKLGELLGWMRQREADQWIDFQSWLARQGKRETATS
jgi:DNA polymerase III alpha subunit (gram-positive type)